MKYIPGGRTISRILYPFPKHRKRDGDHLSNAAYPWVRRSGSPRVLPEISGINSPPIWPCSGRGLPCIWRHRQTGELLPHLFTLTPILRGGFFSVALSVIPSRPDALGSRSRCLRYSEHPTLWSSDFPPRSEPVEQSDHPFYPQGNGLIL